jgi:uncharacterized tellurite resistance protein B-like protein
MFGRWLTGTPTPELSAASERLLALVRRELPEVDEDSRLVILAMTGLLGAVAYADRDYTEAEEARVRAELSRVEGMTEAGISAVCHTLRAHIIEVATLETPRYCRLLVELGDRDLRFEVLRLLVEVAAADGEITTTETNLLRQLTSALGLSQDDYIALQAAHRERLSVLGSRA